MERIINQNKIGMGETKEEYLIRVAERITEFFNGDTAGNPTEDTRKKLNDVWDTAWNNAGEQAKKIISSDKVVIVDKDGNYYPDLIIGVRTDIKGRTITTPSTDLIEEAREEAERLQKICKDKAGLKHLDKSSKYAEGLTKGKMEAYSHLYFELSNIINKLNELKTK